MLMKVFGISAGLMAFHIAPAIADDGLSDRARELLGDYEIGAEVECAEGREKSRRKLRALDDKNVMIRMRDGSAFLAQLGAPGQCKGLYKYGRFHIEKASGPDYCVGDRVTAKTNMQTAGNDLTIGVDHISGGFCHIVAIYELTK